MEGMHLEGGKDLVGVSEGREERLAVGGGAALHESLDGGGIYLREYFSPDALLHRRHGVEAGMHLAEEGADDGEGDVGGVGAWFRLFMQNGQNRLWEIFNGFIY